MGKTMSSIPPHFIGSSPSLSFRYTSSLAYSMEEPVAADECDPVVEGGLGISHPSLVPASQPLMVPEVLHSNIEEAFRVVQNATERAKAFKDWFHGFANILCLLGSRARGNPEDFQRFSLRYQKLLKAEMIRGQLQATYAREDSDRLGRSSSPLVREGYGRAVRTGLWMAAAGVRAEQLRTLLKEAGALLENFEIFPVSRPFEFNGIRPDHICSVEEAALRVAEMAYIAPLRVQLIHKSNPHLDQIQAQLGRRGLRAPPSECADICAESMMRKIDAGDIQGALKLLNKAFDGEPAEAVKAGLAKIELLPNTLIVPKGTDPLTDSTPQQLGQLKETYQRCINHDANSVPFYTESLPFYLEQNIQVIRNLIGDIMDFCQPSMPSTICGDLTEALVSVAELVAQARYRSVTSDNLQGRSQDMERLYQSMQSIHHVIRFQNDWARRAPLLDEAIASLVFGCAQEPAFGLTPDEAGALRTHLKVERAPHAMALLEQVRASLPEQISIACLANGYYETPTLFREPLQCDVVTHPQLPEQDLIIMEPHPNNAAKPSVWAHDPVALINHIFACRPDHSRTLVIDATLNHLSERQITLAMLAAKPHIESGRLNLVLMQSTTKFMQNGMDLASMGVALNFSHSAYWSEYRATMKRHRMYVPEDDEGYIACLLSDGNRLSSIAYLDRIRGNTATLRALLNAKMPPGHQEHNAYEVCLNSDEQTVYIALKPTDVYLAQKLGKASGNQISPGERDRVNIDLYQHRFRPAFRDLSAVDRSSFGFNITNFGECGATVRVTLGIEEPELLHEYSRRIIDLGASLYAEAFGLPDPNAVLA